jgi:signal transduction histidine kinase
MNTTNDDCFNEANQLMDDSASILSNIMGSMGDGLSIQDLNMRIVYQNKFMIDNFGSHTGEYCYKIYEKRNSVCEGCPIIESYRTGQTTKALRVGVTKDGSSFRFENIASVLRDKQGTIVAGIELCRIVEDREKALDDLKEAIEKIKQMQIQLIRSEKLAGIGHLAAGVAHEINNPMSYITSNLITLNDYVKTLKQTILNSQKLLKVLADKNIVEINSTVEDFNETYQKDDISFILNDIDQLLSESLDGARRVKEIVHDLKSFARLDETEVKEVNLNDGIESALKIINNEMKFVSRLIKKFGDIPLLCCYPSLLNQAFLNLIMNAVYAVQEKGEITIETYFEDSNIIIKISDTGCGIPKDVIPKIFDPFFTTKPVGQGTGLGLSIVYSVVTKHNGKIHIESEIGKGSIFTISLPKRGIKRENGMAL